MYAAQRSATSNPARVLPGVIGCLQATETLKLLLGVGKPLVGRILTYDALDQEFRTLKLKKDPQCPACSGALPTLVDYDESCAVPA